MISVENFYWILNDNLIQPTGLDCRYFYPFGTKQNISRDEFRVDQNIGQAKVFLHYDQEPIYAEDDAVIHDIMLGSWIKWPRILANSEHSTLKNKICQEQCLLDWYFFYHGFAALDWYRDSQYTERNEPLQSHFCSLNHRISHRRAYRPALIARYVRDNILHRGVISFHGDHADCEHEIHRPHCDLPLADRNLIQQYIVCKKLNRIVADHDTVDGTFSARFGIHEYRLRQRAFLQMVNETVFFDQKLHLTEKVFQPIVCLRPFLLVAAPGNLAYLKSYGFKTFAPWIDETYDGVLDTTARLDAIAAEVKRISDLPLSTLEHMLSDMQDVLQHNKKHFFGAFRNIIVHELVDNFDRCIRRWNNGRVNYNVPHNFDPDTVKQRLLAISADIEDRT